MTMKNSLRTIAERLVVSSSDGDRYDDMDPDIERVNKRGAEAVKELKSLGLTAVLEPSDYDVDASVVIKGAQYKGLGIDIHVNVGMSVSHFDGKGVTMLPVRSVNDAAKVIKNFPTTKDLRTAYKSAVGMPSKG